MKHALALIAALALPSALALPTGAGAQSAYVVTDCSAVSGLALGPNQPLVEDQTGKLCGLPGGNSFANITTATTTAVKASPGVLHSICVNTLVASGTITAYNNTAGSGAKIATITNPAVLVLEGPLCAYYDLNFSVGLTIVTTGVQDITVSYR